MPQRTYTEEQVTALFKRAAELQAQRESSGGTSEGKHGLTLDELTAIAADAGLDPELLRVAAADIERPEARATTPSRTGGNEVVAERWIAGRLDALSKEDVVAELRHRFERSAGQSMGTYPFGKSTTQTIGRSMEWEYVDPWWGTETRVLVQPREEELRVRVTRRNAYSGGATGWAAWYAPLFAVGAGSLTGPVAGSFLVGFLVALLTLVATTPLLMKASKRAEERHRREVEGVADMIAAHATPTPKAHEAPRVKGPYAGTPIPTAPPRWTSRRRPRSRKGRPVPLASGIRADPTRTPLPSPRS